MLANIFKGRNKLSTKHVSNSFIAFLELRTRQILIKSFDNESWIVFVGGFFNPQSKKKLAHSNEKVDFSDSDYLILESKLFLTWTITQKNTIQ